MPEHHATAVTRAGSGAFDKRLPNTEPNCRPRSAPCHSQSPGTWDAFAVADATRSMPHPLRAIDGEDETIAELGMIVGFHDDLAGEATRVANRLHGLLTQIHPPLERVPGSRAVFLSVLAARGARPRGPTTTRRSLRASTDPGLLHLARRRADVLFAMLRDGTFYEPQRSAALT